jgi:hypothetical protein
MVSRPISRDLTRGLSFDASGRRYAGLVAAAISIAFADGAPAGLTETATHTVGTYRDSGGELRNTVSATPTIDHDINGNILGLQCFTARTNVCTNDNSTPTATTNMTLTDLGSSASLTTTTDATYIPGFKMSNVISSSVYQLYGGTAGAECEISGNIGSTGDCAAQVAIRVLQSGRTCYLGHTNDKTNTVFSNYPDYAQVKAEDMTASATTDKMVIKVPAFTTVRFTLNQFETGAKASPTIIVDGASATTVKNFCQMTMPNGFNVDAGAAIVEAMALYDTGNANAAGVVVLGSTGGFPTDAYYMQSNQSSNLPNAYAKGNGSALNIAAASTFIAGRHHSIGMIWENAGDIRSFAGAMQTTNTTITMPDTASGINTITFGAFAANTWQFNGWIKSLKIFDKNYSMRQLSKHAIGSVTGNQERGIAFGGQSNGEGYFSAANVYTNGGERAMIAIMNDVWGTTKRNWGINGTTGGSSLVGWQGSGAFITKWKEIIGNYRHAGGVVEALYFNQGQSNMGNTPTWWEDETVEVINDMLSYSGASKAFIQQNGQYRLNGTDGHKDNCRDWKLGYHNAAANNSSIILLPTNAIHPLLSDGVHLTDAGYTADAQIITRFMLDNLGYTVSGDVTPPSITGVSRSGTTVTVTITHGDGTDFTIGGVAGWEFLDDGTRIEVTAAVRTNATTITLTLASAPTGTEVLRYLYGSGYEHDGVTTEDPADYVKDNSSPYNLPLFPGEFSVPT